MAVAIMKTQLCGFIQSMNVEGIVNSQCYKLQTMTEAIRRDYVVRARILNDQFNRIHSLNRTREPDCVVKLIESYFEDVEAILAEFSSHGDRANVDFSKLAALGREIEDKSTSIGAELVRLSCPELIQACDEKNKRKFDQALMWVKSEFAHTRSRLESYLRMERRIIRLTNRTQASSSS